MLKSPGSSKIILFLLFVFFTEIATQKLIRAVVVFGKVAQPLNAIGVPRGAEGPSRGRAREGESLFVRGVRGISPEKIFKFKMSVEAILMHVETMFACEIRLNVQVFHVAVCKRVSNATNKE